MIRRFLARLFLPILRIFFPRLGLVPSISFPSPTERVPKVEYGCDSGGFSPPPPGLGELRLTAGDDIGLFQGDSVILAEPINVVGPFIVLANDDIVVSAPVTRDRNAGGDRNIVLVSFNGTVRIESGIVGSGMASPGSGTPRGAISSGRPGGPGSLTLLAGISVEIDAIVWGEGGGWGEGIFTDTNARRARSYAFGGPGGAGGDVLICAFEGVRIGRLGRVQAGRGGHGGLADARGAHDAEVMAVGGPAHQGGDIVIRGLSADAACQVFMENGSRVQAGQGGYGTLGMAQPNFALPPRPLTGGLATAIGGEGGTGGSVRFENCSVVRVGFVESGHGGDGGTAYARGGDGGSGPDGFGGGDATARGGTAGASGPEPQIPLPDGTLDRGQRGRSGAGRVATVRPGSGGSAADPNGLGGFSGSGSATGGASGGGGQAQEKVVAPVPSQGTQGGTAGDGRSEGAR